MTLTLETERMQAHVENGVGWMVFNNKKKTESSPSPNSIHATNNDQLLNKSNGSGSSQRVDDQ